MSPYEIWTVILQGAIIIIATATLVVYYRQLKVMTSQLSSMQSASQAQSTLTLVAFLQQQEVREHRTVVRERLSKKAFTEWTSDERRSAAFVVANYDVAAAMIRAGVAPPALIVENWGPSIVHCHEVLTPFIAEKRAEPGNTPRYWQNFDWLAQQARVGALALR